MFCRLSEKSASRTPLRTPLKAFSISHTDWEQTAKDRASWRAALHQGSKAHEANKDCCCQAAQRGQEGPCQQEPCRCHNSLSALPQNISCADWPDKSSAHPPTMSLGRHDGLRRIDGRTTNCSLNTCSHAIHKS